jgi:hypothetical protein
MAARASSSLPSEAERTACWLGPRVDPSAEVAQKLAVALEYVSNALTEVETRSLRGFRVADWDAMRVKLSGPGALDRPHRFALARTVPFCSHSGLRAE